jgi:hypothetical protein
MLGLSTRLFSMAATPSPVFKAFNLALIQLGQVGPDKSTNLSHARESVLKAAANNPKPDLIALPVGLDSPCLKHVLNTVTGMFQLSIRTCTLPRLRRIDRIHQR